MISEEQLLEEYKPLVEKIAKITYTSSSVIGIDDLIQIGKMAVINAVRTFDPSCGPNLKSYINLLVRQAIFKEAGTFCGVFTLPQKVLSKASRINRLYNDGVSLEKIQDLTETPIDNIKDLLILYRHITTKGIHDALNKAYESSPDVMKFLQNLSLTKIEESILWDKILGDKDVDYIAKESGLTIRHVYEIENNLKSRIIEKIYE